MKPIEGTAENIEELLEKSDYVLIDFWASWCGPCQAFAPVFEAAAKEHKDITFIKVNSDEQPAISQAFGVRALPTLVGFAEQMPLFAQAGALQKAQLAQVIEVLKDPKTVEEAKAHMEKHAAEAGA
jgi:thioredoxin 1